MKHETSGNTRQRILDEARHQISALGFKRMTVLAVAEALGLTHAAVYRHFPSKQALIDTLIDEWMAQALEAVDVAAIGADAAGQISALLTAEARLKRATFSTDRALYDAFEEISGRRPDAARAHLDTMRGLVSDRLLADPGLTLNDAQADALANLVIDATERFRHPLLIDLDDSTFPHRIAAIVRALLAGREAI